MQDDYSFFKTAILRQTGIDLSAYKERQMKRRLETLYKQHHFYSFRSFFQRGLQNDPALWQAFFDKMTINVSEFYRNKKRWERFEFDILPQLLETRGKLQLWSAACSSGEEAYTAAMITSKYRALTDVSILATDIDREALQRAKAGRYQEKSVREVVPAERKRCFDEEGNHYRVKPMFRDTIRFKRHNLLADPYPREQDLIICRNALIYFTNAAKEQIYHRLNQSLKSGGFLFVGSTEQLFSPETYGFEHVGNFFYRKRHSSSRLW
ncbi:CheR family methyltransferase [Natribacillus halophilus]|uniref:protein-glutamate O-methyltransferase n=1 Tax=Natribacillus halophilus TaxID=549003 RepID=A0A1G8JC87_9BACI|nr:protein-glutamate O-methyltransferase CheR [Natribacillus halophilus]SDI28786.1 chemotaxis protein methyltransferase CheR [Natribacillus halophilus]